LNSLIHPTAVIHPEAELHESATVGPYTVIEAGVRIGARCRVGPHCHILGETQIGEDNEIHAGCVLGDTPQDLAYKDALSSLIIGNGNRIREHVTIHRGTAEGSATRIGDRNFLMAHCHIGHNSVLGNDVIVVNAVLLGGHVEVEDRAFLGGGAVVHQHCRIGTLTILRGLSRISKDVPPYCTVVENNELVGLNSIGLKRAGILPDERARLKTAYALLFNEGLNLTQALEALKKETLTPQVSHLIEFITQSKRGICFARKKPTDLGEEN